MIPKLEVSHLCYSYHTMEGETEALSDLSFQVQTGEFLAVVGPSGCGKSTLLSLICGLLKPDSGRILFNGEDITGLSITERARMGISYAFQQPVRFKGITVRDLIELASGEKLDRDHACKYLVEVGLCAANYIDREVNESLSGGEIKRIEIAVALARKSALSIFDEPEAGIDLWSFRNLIGVFEHLQDQLHGSILIISHQERILNIADEIIVLANGSIRTMGPREEVLPHLLKEESQAFCPRETN